MEIYISEIKYSTSLEFAALCLEMYTGKDRNTFEFYKDEYGKPFLNPNFAVFLHFSISHSGNIIVCAVSEENVGIDCEKKDINIERCTKISARFFHREEQDFLSQISNSAEYTEKFIEIWTKKEAFIKFTGKGLSQGLNTFSVFGNLKYDTFDYKNNYKISVCREKDGKLNITEV